MSVKLRKKSSGSSGLTTSEKKIKEMIEMQIKNILSAYFGIERSIYLRKSKYFLVFGVCKFTSEKSVLSVHLKSPTRSNYEKITADEIEISGVTIVEFLDFINKHGAAETNSPFKLLESV